MKIQDMSYTSLKIYLQVLNAPDTWGREMKKNIKKGFDIEAEKVNVHAELLARFNKKNCTTCVDEGKDLTHRVCRACVMYEQSTGKKYSEWRSK